MRISSPQMLVCTQSQVNFHLPRKKNCIFFQSQFLMRSKFEVVAKCEMNITLRTIYSILSDVEELHLWHVAKCTAHPYFERIPDDEVLAEDPAVKAMLELTEEGIKVARLGGKKYFAVFRRRLESELPITQFNLLWEAEVQKD